MQSIFANSGGRHKTARKSDLLSDQDWSLGSGCLRNQLITSRVRKQNMNVKSSVVLCEEAGKLCHDIPARVIVADQVLSPVKFSAENIELHHLSPTVYGLPRASSSIDHAERYFIHLVKT
ncbi:uncharacterized [Tachysurus ichikawai]